MGVGQLEHGKKQEGRFLSAACLEKEKKWMKSKERWKLLKQFLAIDIVSSQSNLNILFGFTELQKYRNKYTFETKKMEKSSIKIIVAISKVHCAIIGNSKYILEFSLSLKAQQLKVWPTYQINITQILKTII